MVAARDGKDKSLNADPFARDDGARRRCSRCDKLLPHYRPLMTRRIGDEIWKKASAARRDLISGTKRCRKRVFAQRQSVGKTSRLAFNRQVR